MSTVKIRRSGTTTSTPSSLDHGELAINYADAKLFWKDATNTIRSFVFQAYASATHKIQHATGGADALTPSDIGAAPAASPAITGNATFEASSGVPVTITNTGSGNSFVVNDASGDTSPFLIDASGNIEAGPNKRTIGVSSRMHISADNANWGTPLCVVCDSVGRGPVVVSADYSPNPDVGSQLYFNASTGGFTIGCSSPGNSALGSVTFSASQIVTPAGTAAAPAIVASGDSNTGLLFPAADTFAISTAGSERVRVDSSGRVGIGRTPLVSGTSLEVGGDIFVAPSKSLAFYHTNNTAGIGTPSGAGLQFWAKGDASDSIRFQGRNADGSFNSTDLLRITTGGASLGNIGIQTNSPTARLDINSDTIRLRTAKTPASASDTGNAGDICWDASYLYICTATNTWRRIAHSTW